MIGRRIKLLKKIKNIYSSVYYLFNLMFEMADAMLDYMLRGNGNINLSHFQERI